MYGKCWLAASSPRLVFWLNHENYGGARNVLLSGAVERPAQDLVLSQGSRQGADLKGFIKGISRYDLARVLPIIAGSEAGAATLLGIDRPV